MGLQVQNQSWKLRWAKIIVAFFIAAALAVALPAIVVANHFIIFGCIGLVASVGVAAAMGARNGKRMFHGVLLPVTVFISLSLFLYGLGYRPSEFYSLGGPFSDVVGLSVLLILMFNALLMLPKWKKRRTVWLIGSIIPACLFVLEVLYLMRICSPLYHYSLFNHP